MNAENNDPNPSNQGNPSNWDPTGSQPPNAGTTPEGDLVSFKEGVAGSSKEGQFLTASGDYSQDAKGFDANHNHAGRDFNVDKGADNNDYGDE